MASLRVSALSRVTMLPAMRVMRKVWSVLRWTMDGRDAIGALVAFVVVVVLLATGHVPRDVELWLYALAGGALVFGIAFATVAWVRRRS